MYVSKYVCVCSGVVLWLGRFWYLTFFHENAIDKKNFESKQKKQQKI